MWFLCNIDYNLIQMVKVNFAIILALLAIAFSSCTDIKSLPVEPRIKFTSFTVFDTVDILGNTAKGGRLKFYFEDGDGNVGLPPPEGVNTDSTNLYLTLYRMTNGVLSRAPEDDPLNPSDYRIPYMQKKGQNTILQGTIAVTFLYLFFSEDDSVKYSFYIRDRDENISNTDSTTVIPISVNGTYQ